MLPEVEWRFSHRGLLLPSSGCQFFVHGAMVHRRGSAVRVWANWFLEDPRVDLLPPSLSLPPVRFSVVTQPLIVVNLVFWLILIRLMSSF